MHTHTCTYLSVQVCHNPRAGAQGSNRSQNARACAKWQRGKKLLTLLDLCVSSLRRGHANLSLYRSNFNG